jgi:sugar/nucleoside kinase (ribokinase family)
VLAIGDVFVDSVCDLDARGIPLTLGYREEIDVSAPVLTLVGGGGLQFALAGRDAGFDPVICVGKVGAKEGELDVSAEYALREANSAGIEVLWGRDEMLSTGRALIVFGPEGQRLMISDPGANRSFSLSDLSAEMKEAASAVDLIYVSGYALMQAERRTATIELMRLGKAAGAVVAVDLVPHNFYELYDPEDLLRSIKDTVDWLIAASSTAHRIVKDELTDTTDGAISNLLRWAGSGVVFDEPGMVHVLTNGSRSSWKFDYETGASNRGQSARVQAAILAAYI